MAAKFLPPFKAQLFPLIELRIKEKIKFLHPGYPELQNALLIDRGVNDRVNHGTALLAYQIIASNAFEIGCLTLDKRVNKQSTCHRTAFSQRGLTISSLGMALVCSFYLTLTS
jgi:hypothetical protein